MKYKNLSLIALKSLPDHELRMDRDNYNAYLGLPEIHTKDMPVEVVKEELQKINDEIVRRPMKAYADAFNKEFGHKYF